MKKNFDLLPRLFHYGRVIATNNAYRITPNAEILHFADEIWYSWHAKEIPQIFRGRYITTAALGVSKKVWPSRGIIHFRKDSNNGISTSTSCLSGSNSGHQAINLAVHMGSKEIVLLGFDMNPASLETNWHKEHKRQTNRNSYRDVMIPGMIKSVPVLEKMNVKVINANKESFLDCFPKTSLGELLNRYDDNKQK